MGQSCCVCERVTMEMERVLQFLLSWLIVQVSANAQDQAVPAFLQNTFFSQNRIAVPAIPNSIRQPALNAPAFSPYQTSPFSRPQSPAGSSVGAAFSGLGQIASLGFQRPLSQFSQLPPAVEGSPASSLRLGKAIESSSISKPPQSAPSPATFNQFSPGPQVSQPSLQESLSQALNQAAKSARPTPGVANFGRQSSAGSSQGSLPPTFRLTQAPQSDLDQAQPQFPTRTSPGAAFSNLGQNPSLGFQQRPFSQFSPTIGGSQASSLRLGNTIQSSSVSKPPPSAPAPATFNQFSPRPEASRPSLQQSLGQALDQAAKSAQFSLARNTSPGPTQGAATFGRPSIARQGPDSQQGSGNSFEPNLSQPFPQRLESGSSQGSLPAKFRSTQFSSGSGFSQVPELDLDQALTKASEAAAGANNFGPLNPAALPSEPLLEEINLVGPSPGSFRSVESNRENTKAKSSPFRKQVFAAIPAGNALDRPQIFRSDPKIAEQRFQQNGSPSRSKISLSRTTVSETPKSSLVKTCSKTLIEECHNEYSMVCEETFTEREKYECKTVEETKCENGFTTEYEPACFQQILDNCQNICKRGVQPDCMPQCARSLGKTSCHKVKVVTPHTTCTKVPKEVCGNVKKQVPYEKCHDVPRKVCEQVPRENCN